MTVARTFTVDGAGRLGVPGMLTGYLLMVLVAWAFSRACRANVAKDRRIGEIVDERDQALADLDDVITERDEARRQWALWYGRATEAETRDQGARPLVRRIRCTATAGRGAT